MVEVTREEYSQGQNRIHSRIDEIKESSIRTEESVKRSEEMVNKMFGLFYGNGNDGLMVKLGKLVGAVKTHFRLIMLCLGGIITTAFFAIRSMFTR